MSPGQYHESESFELLIIYSVRTPLGKPSRRGCVTVQYGHFNGVVVQLVDPHYLTLKAGGLWAGDPIEGRNGVTLYCTLHSAWGTGSVLVHPVQWPKATELVHSRMCSK